jgi:formate dehydrogenase major subunit
MNPEGTARLFSRGMMKDGPFPAHYEPFESPVVNVLAPKIRGNPAARIFKDDLAALGNSDKFPYAATSYRLTEHFHYWTKHVWVNAVLQPEFFVEISEQLAAEKNIKAGGLGEGVLGARRGLSEGCGDQAHQAADLRRQDRACGRYPAPLGASLVRPRKGFGPNSLTPFVGDANIETPEFKAFLVNVEPSNGPATS